MRVRFDGSIRPAVLPKDLILHLIGEIGAAGVTGYAVKYAGSAIESMPLEGRLTICNLSIELGAKMGFLGPDDTIYAYLRGRPYAPAGADWEEAVATWRLLPSDPGAVLDREVTIDVADVAPQIMWGTSPEHVVAVDGSTPDPTAETDPVKRRAMKGALAYMGLAPGGPIVSMTLLVVAGLSALAAR